MARLDVKLKGLDGLEKKLKRYGAREQRAVKIAVRSGLSQIQAEAKQWAPHSPLQPPIKDPPSKSTGRLRQSIATNVDVSGTSGRVGTNIPYAPFQEFGTRVIPARPFLMPAFERVRPKFLRELVDRLNKAGSL